MSDTEMSESTAGEVRPSEPGESEEGEPTATEGDVLTSTGEEDDSEYENEDVPDTTTEGGEGPPPESPLLTEDVITAPIEGKEEYGERTDMSDLASEDGEVGFSEYEMSSNYFEEEEEDKPLQQLPSIYSSDVIQVFSKQVEHPEMPTSKMTIDTPSSREKSPEKEVKRSYSISESDEELTKIPVPTVKANKVIPKQPEPKYQLWPVKVFESENLHKIMELAVPRFFPRNFQYSVRGVTKRCSLLAQYLQRKVFQMGHDRRKLITVVRYHQKNWNGHKAVIRWLWCMETDGLVKYAHEGEGFVVSAVVIGLYMD